MVFIPGQPDYELVAGKKDEFDIKIAKGYSLKFELNDKNEVLSMTFMQPNGNFKATRKKQVNEKNYLLLICCTSFFMQAT